MKFSILIPVYNVEKYLEGCLDSVLCQDYADYEVIIVDDGATDGSGAICDAYRQKFPEKIQVIHKENQGLISARRVGIAKAQGEYCIFVDSDDQVRPNLLSEIVRYMDQCGDPDIVLYSFQYMKDGKPGKKYPHPFRDGQVWQGEEKKELYSCLLSGCDIDALWTKAIRTSILKDDPIPYEKYYAFNMSEDTLQSIDPLTRARKIVYADQALYLYRLIDSSISHNFSVKTLEKKNTNHVYQTILEYLPAWGLDDGETRQRLEARWFHEAMYTFCNYYEAASNGTARREILSFHWDKMIPFPMHENPYFSPVYLRVYTSLKSGNQSYLKYFFAKRKIKKLWKSIKK